ncbi:carbohydrate kinase family protein [Nocardia huaxiensis]|uniref:Carbohydrate kinase family protein n=1 Tax=Nocardia huaxiensis TaxID=2755382 RepID=A0A7D6VBK6_9NOCA|nr:PfkB family carbohydrate kinase [Nocardia huaxiensis]QLY30402.1 carbohydrate kinase family protein [Nocardia huaxiensis]
MVNPSGPVVCVSYLAYAELWTVPQFPRPNHGERITSIEPSLAADGPMTAAVLASLGVPSLLLSNDIGNDDCGRFVQQWLTERHVEARFNARPETNTPRIVVAADEDHTRTWFAHLPGVVDSLEQVDLAPIVEASFLYLDCYELIERAALRVIDVGCAAQVPMLLNLGGSALSERMAPVLAGNPNLLLQTNVDDINHREAPGIARTLLEQTGARWVIVTAGSFGAVAVSDAEEVAVLAFRVDVRHTHCAGAAFSGGLLYGLRAGWPMERSMVLGSASAALRCVRPHNAPLPTRVELERLLTHHSSGEEVATLG